jgi:peptidoglycan hydrolase-like protein with peptidoglycan-binding domain
VARRRRRRTPAPQNLSESRDGPALRALKIIGCAVVGLPVAAAGAAHVGGSAILARALEHPIGDDLGRGITVAGPVSVQWGFPTRLTLRNVKVANAPWGASSAMFEAAEIEAGRIDGIVGPKTRAAIREFQRSAGLSETGEIGARTRTALFGAQG